MLKRIFYLVFLILFQIFFFLPGESAIKIVENKVAKSLIVIPSVPREETSLQNRRDEVESANILQRYINLMSGVKLDIVKEADLKDITIEKDKIVLKSGKYAGFNFILIGDGDITKKLGINTDILKPAGVMIKTGQNYIVITGAKEVNGGGVKKAVFELLEKLGCRYLWPGEVGEVIPNKETIEIDGVDIVYNPPIPQRGVRWGNVLADRPLSGLEFLGVITKDEFGKLFSEKGKNKGNTGWFLWYGVGGDFGIRGGHAFSWVYPKYGQEHPEWFALQADGTRDMSKVSPDRVRLCKSNPELIKAIAEYIIEQVKKNPNVKSVSISPNDGGYASFCMCEECKKLDPPNAPKIKMTIFKKPGEPAREEIEYVSLTDRMVYFWNSIAEIVTKEYPDLLFVADAYSVYSHPPVERKLHPNIVIRYVPSTEEHWDDWKKAGAKYIFWRPNILHEGGARRNVKPHVMVDRLCRLMKFFTDNGTIATDFDSILHHWSLHGLNYYAVAKLVWNPYLKPEEIIKDYCLGFGKGAKYIEDYFLTIQYITENKKEWEIYDFEKLREKLKKAEEAVKDELEIISRINFLRIGLNFVEVEFLLDEYVKKKETGEKIDQDKVKKLLDLHYLMMIDILLNNPYAVNVPYYIWGTGKFARWQSIGGRNYKSPEELVKKFLSDETMRMTGKENSIEELLSIYKF